MQAGAALGATGTTCCPCGRGNASYSYRLEQYACARCYLSSIPLTEREATDRAWARRDLAGQVRGVAHRLGDDPRAARLRDLAFDLESAASDRAAAPVIDDLRDAGIALGVRT